ncbi:phosphatidylserine decarboxylase proenzyme, mitochondrial isoform X1 [Bradysia coprophila]|uniref:phosphatidylserine decarboxylase proenzyme, mitochondrial isoform X1 n=1 Tax=Bradysia coprophila TaxID=38358 RepID=UPI00187DB1D4|nr:phosphatidylserine decarboxylase proenzyme, mitochondrial isoform X1 [Bradysia coprophila]
MSVYFVSRKRIFSTVTHGTQRNWTPRWFNIRKSFKSTGTNSNYGKPFSNGETVEITKKLATKGNGDQQGQQHSSSKKGKLNKLKKFHKLWSWKAGAGWTILSVLDWWLLAAGGWLTWRGVFLKWTPLGLCLVAAAQWTMINDGPNGKGQPRTATAWQTNIYCSLPLRLISRGWGWLADCRVPIPIRPIVYGCYSTAFGVNIEEAAASDFKKYRSIAEFFTRSLKEDARTIDTNSCLVSPADGRVLHFGLATNEQVEQVKGVTYSLKSFLGPANWENKSSPTYVDTIRIRDDEETAIYQCIIYLAPGDYHRFHSPTKWTPKLRRHFSGELLSVSPKIAHWLPGLFSLNERALYLGRWQHGFFSFAAVGATNVGSIQIYMDESLQTNKWHGFKVGKLNKTEHFDEIELPQDTILEKGQLLGQFNMGSTVVLIFEAPKYFKFFVEQGQTIKMGEPLGCTKNRRNFDEIKNEIAAAS